MSQFVWHFDSTWWTYLSRFAIGVAFLCAFFLYLRSWLTSHGLSVHREDRVSTVDLPEFAALAADDLLDAVEGLAANGLDAMNLAEARKLAQHLTQPELFRYRTIEDIEVKRQDLLHRFTILWHEDSTVRIGDHEYVPIMRTRKEQSPRELTVAGGRLLSAFETLALLYITCLRLSRLPRNLEEAEATREVRSKLLQLIAGSPRTDDALTSQAISQAMTTLGHEESLLGRLRRIGIRPTSTEPELESLLGVIDGRRPYFAVYRADARDPRHASEASYRANFTRPSTQPEYDWWRTLKDQLRERLNLAPRLLYIPLERARSSDSYQLYVHCDEKLYVDESNVWEGDSRRWLSPMPRSGNYRAYLGWASPSGKAFASFGAAKLCATHAMKDFHFVLRLREKPPGTLGPAATVAFSTTVAIWIVGALSPGSQAGVDMVAFVLAIPAVGATFLGLSTADAQHDLRSLTGFLSFVGSFVLSLVAIVVFLFQHEEGHAARTMPLGKMRYIYFISDYLWIILLAVAMSLLLVTIGTLTMRGVRYGMLKRNLQTDVVSASSPAPG